MTGVYYLYDPPEVIYVGASVNVEKRVREHGRAGLSFAGYFCDKCKKSELAKREAEAIREYRPKYNCNAVLGA